jgi:hypothetical protein
MEAGSSTGAIGEQLNMRLHRNELEEMLIADFLHVSDSALYRSLQGREALSMPKQTAARFDSQRAFKPWDNGDAGAVAEGGDSGILLRY